MAGHKKPEDQLKKPLPAAEHPAQPRAASPAPQKKPSGHDGGRLTWYVHGVGGDIARFSPRRSWAVARLAVSEALRLKILGVLAIGLVAVVLADLSARRFDPVFDVAPSLIKIAEVTITAVGLAVAVFLSTYSLPRELTSKTIYSLVTKPVSRLEIIVGKLAGVSLTLLVVTLGLGALCLGYFEIRGRQIERLADERLAERRAKSSAEAPRLPTDVAPRRLESIATEGPFRATVYKSATEPLEIVHRVEQSPLDWLSGYRSHRANWGFEGLPIEAVNTGQALVRIALAYDLPPDMPETASVRQVAVGLYDQDARESWGQVMEVPLDGHLQFTIPPQGIHGKSRYEGGRLWVRLEGMGGFPIGVKSDSCVIDVGGRRWQSASGLRLTGTFHLNQHWLGNQPADRKLRARAVFASVPSGEVGPSGTTLEVDVVVPMATNIPATARASVYIVNETTGKSLTATFRPERGATVLIPLERSFFGGGTLAAYVSADDRAVEIGLTDQSIRLRVAARPFAWNWLKDLLMMWLMFCVVSSIGVLMSTMAGWYVASFATAILLLVANVWPALVSAVSRGTLASYSWLNFGGDRGVMREIAHAYGAIFKTMGVLLPDMPRIDYGETVANGINAPLGAMLALPGGALWHVLLYSCVMLVLGYLIFRAREVAQ